MPVGEKRANGCFHASASPAYLPTYQPTNRPADPPCRQVDGIDVFFVAFADLAQSMGYLHDLSHPEVRRVTREAIGRIVQAGRCAGSTPTSAEEGAAHRALGARFFYTQPLPLAGAGLHSYIASVDPTHHSL
jgi:hypothetical protein